MSQELNIFFQSFTLSRSRSKVDYYKVKALELLLYLDALQFSDSKEDRPYFYKGQVEKIKAIHDLITANLQEHYTMDELAERFQISLTGMKPALRKYTEIPCIPIFAVIG